MAHERHRTQNHAGRPRPIPPRRFTSFHCAHQELSRAVPRVLGVGGAVGGQGGSAQGWSGGDCEVVEVL
ncbi:MAG: hypothetical protein L6R35_006834, partial [Caloplaca aegaea]